jgi:WD40 repeat protein
MLGGIAFSPDGNQLAVAAANRSLIVWNLPALRQALEARGIPTGEL